MRDDDVVAIEDDDVIGVAHMLSDGEIQAHLSLIVVATPRRRRGIARRLIEHAFADSGAERVDLVTNSAPEFYETFRHRRFNGFRIYPAFVTDGERSAPE